MNKQCIFSIGMSNYLRFGGGTNITTKMHQTFYNKKNISYVFVCPFVVKQKQFHDYWEIILDGQQLAILSLKNLLDYIACFEGKTKIIEVHVHHTIYARNDDIKKMVAEINSAAKFFIHDFYTIDKNFTLTNDRGEQYLSVEKYDKLHDVPFMSKLNKYRYYNKTLWDSKTEKQFILPSSFSKEVWTNFYPEYKKDCHVIPHFVFSGEYRENKGVSNRIKVAYLGSREDYKGWLVFDELVRHNDNVDWYYFGKDDIDLKKIKCIYSDNFQDNNQMIDNLRNSKIDLAILWSLCPETYSYTYFECLASNVLVITNNCSGNICSETLRNKNGFVLKNEMELNDFIKKIDSKMILEKKQNVFSPLTLTINPDIIPKNYSKQCETAKLPLPKMSPIEKVLNFAIIRKIKQKEKKLR